MPSYELGPSVLQTSQICGAGDGRTDTRGLPCESAQWTNAHTLTHTEGHATSLAGPQN